MKKDSEKSYTYSLLGIVTFFLPALPIIMTVLGLIYGYRALKTETEVEQIKKAKAGIKLGYISVGVNILYFIFSLIVVIIAFDFLANVWCGLNGGTDCNYIIQY